MDGGLGSHSADRDPVHGRPAQHPAVARLVQSGLPAHARRGRADREDVRSRCLPHQDGARQRGIGDGWGAEKPWQRYQIVHGRQRGYARRDGRRAGGAGLHRQSRHPRRRRRRGPHDGLGGRRPAEGAFRARRMGHGGARFHAEAARFVWRRPLVAGCVAAHRSPQFRVGPNRSARSWRTCPRF